MALKQSKQVVAGYQCPSPDDAACPVLITGEYVTVTGDAVGDIVEFGGIPDNCIVVDLVLDNGALGAGATLDAGILSGDYASKLSSRTIGAEFFAASAAATAGVIRRAKSINAVAVSEAVQGWGIKFLGADPAVGQTIRATLMVRSAPVGVI